VTAQLIDINDAAHLFDLEDVLDHIFQQGFVDPKWRSVAWWEELGAPQSEPHRVRAARARRGKQPCDEGR